MPRRSLAALLAIAAALSVAAPAAAQWTVCNRSTYVIETAVAFTEAGRRVTQGWTRIRPMSCEAVLTEALTPGDHFLFARTSSAHKGGRHTWSGTEELCVDTGDFSLAGEAVCEEVGFMTRRFARIAVDEPEKRTTLSEPRNYRGNEDRITTAGLQRLLADNGYDMGDLDGFAGRRTTRAVRDFVRSQNLEDEPPRDELIDLLEAAARRNASVGGLTVCNEAEDRAWTAVAVRVDERWESRGWWPLETGQCATIFDQPLDQPAYYVYAALRDDGEDRPLAAGSEVFCLAETRFAILGRENCAGRGHTPGRFATVLADDNGVARIELQSDDFVSAPLSRRLRP